MTIINDTPHFNKYNKLLMQLIHRLVTQAKLSNTHKLSQKRLSQTHKLTHRLPHKKPDL